MNTLSVSDPEKKQYIVLYVDMGQDEDDLLRWESFQGRTAAYEAIKVNAPVIDIEKSIVLVDGVDISDALNVREFCDYLKNSDIIKDETFDIHDYDSSYI